MKYSNYSNEVFGNTVIDNFIGSGINFALPQFMHGAYYYNGNTYIVYQGNVHEDPFCVKFNHAAKTFSAPVQVGVKAIGDVNHGQPIIHVDASGYIHVMFGAHSTTIQYSKSTNPEDITEWTAMDSPADGSYPQLVQFSTGVIYMVYRTTSMHWAFKSSSNNGTSWSAATELCGLEFGYISIKKGIGDKIHLVVWGYPYTTNYDRFNIYYLTFNGTLWQNIDGDTLTLPVDHEDDMLVLDSGTDEIPSCCLGITPSDKPIIHFSAGVGTADPLGDYSFKIAKYEAGAWVISDTGEGANNWGDYATCIDVRSEDQYDLYLVKDGGTDRGGFIHKVITTNGGDTWTDKGDMIGDAKQYADPAIVGNLNRLARVVIFQAPPLFPNAYSGMGFLWGDEGFLY